MGHSSCVHFTKSSYTRRNRSRRCSTAYRFRDSSVFTLTSGRGGDFLEAATFDLVRYKHIALFFW